MAELEEAAPVPGSAALDLAHLAQSAARFFISTELVHDAGQLTRLGTGEIRCDLIQRLTRHGHQWVPMLRTAEILRHRLIAALRARDLPWSTLVRAEVEAQATLTRGDSPELPGIQGGWAGPGGPMHRCAMQVTVRLATAQGQWQGIHRGATEWPDWWSQRHP